MNIPQKKDKVLTGYGDKDGKWRNDPNFIAAMTMCNWQIKSFVPVRKQKRGGKNET